MKNSQTKSKKFSFLKVGYKGTHLNLATQAKLKQLGYNGKF